MIEWIDDWLPIGNLLVLANTVEAEVQQWSEKLQQIDMLFDGLH